MKHTLRRFYSHLFLFLLAAIALALAAPLIAASEDADASAARKAPVANPDAPASHQEAVNVMVEMNAAPAAAAYAEALKVAQSQADAARNYALAHPTQKASKTLLAQKPQAVQISSTAASRVSTTVKQLDQAQQAIVPALTSGDINGRILYRAQRAYNGIAMIVDPAKISAIEALPGVKAVHPMYPKFHAAAFSDIDFVGGRSFWAKLPFGIHGENIKVADIDTGLDYIHTDFGGPGSSGYSAVTNHTVAPNPYFPTPKVPGGFDFAGDAYAATNNPADPSNTPHPDPDPFDCAGHGTGTASLIAGYGVTNAGFTYSGTYDAANPSMANLSISPGFAPNAKLYPLRVFGCGGSTNLVTEAIEWAMDPNGDGNFSDHMDVINMSLGANERPADDADSVAASNAAAIGIIVCSAAGNAGDTFYVHSSPAAAKGTLSVAATFNDANGYIFDSVVNGNQPAALAGSSFKGIKPSGSAPIPAGGLTGNVVYAIPADGGPAQTPALATPYTNAAQINGNICLVDRGGGVSFEQKVRRAIASGATGVIIANNANNPRNDFPPINVGLFFNSTIPVVGISLNDGNTLKAAAAFDPATGLSTSTPPANVTLANSAGTLVVAANPAGSAAGAGSPDTVPSYTSRGPGLPDSTVKPDVAAPAEVTGVALNNSGNGFENFNGTSSATPHVAGSMALLKQMHPTWSVQELNALICGTATHDLATTVGGSTKIGVGRIGAGRIDLTNASNANVVAYNGTDSNVTGVSFGDVEVPVDGSVTLTKAIKVVNKGGSDVTYNLTYQDINAASGTNYTVPASVTVLAGNSATFNVTFTATGSALRHERDLSTSTSQATDFGTFSRQYLTEKTGYAVLTPTAGSEPTQRVALYAAPKPSSSMHVTTNGVTPTAASGSFTLNLSGTPINTGASFPTDIVSYAKAYELQYASPLAGSPNAPTDPNVLKYVGITTDWANRTAAEQNNFIPWVNFALEGFGNSTVPDFNTSDKEILIDLNFDNVPDIQIFLNRLPSAGSPTNVYFSYLTDIAGVFGPPNTTYAWEPTNARSPAPTSRDTNSFNNSVITVPIDGLVGTGATSFQYQVVTFDSNSAIVDQTPFLFFDAANPGLDATPPATLEPFFLNDLPTTALNVKYNGTNFQTDGSLGVMVVHMHNGTGNHVDVVALRKPTISGFSPTSGKVGAQITITGSNFGPGTNVTFFNNKPAASVNVLTPTTLVATVPAGAVSGPIRVSNAAGASSRPGFTVLP
jgi:subtilisin family serine protease